MRKAFESVTVALFALAGTLALMLVNTDLTSSTCFLFFVQSVLATLAGRETAAALVLILLLWLHARFAFRPYAWRHGDRLKLCLLAAVFAFAASVGAAYRADDGLLAEFLTPYHLALLAGKAVGFFTLFYVGMKALLLSLPKAAGRLAFGGTAGPRAARGAFFKALLIIACVWLPSFVAHFPGTITADGGRVLQQFFGEIAATGDHPPGYTWLVGSIVALGRAIAGDWFGIFLYTFLQWLFLLCMMAWSVAELEREGCPKVFGCALTVLYALLPLSMQAGTAVIKDIPYAAAFLGWVLLTARAYLHPREAWHSRRWWAGYTVLTLMVLLLRHNGALAVVPAAVALLVRFRLSAKPQGRWKYGLLALPVALLLLFDGLVVPQIAIPVESSADLLGVAIQQTARILKNAPQDVSAEEMTVIDRVLEADRLAEAYLPKKSDPVRRLYRYFNGHTRADVLAFAGVAAKLAAAHPLTALHAFWSLNGGYLDPFDVSGARFNIALSDTSPKYPAALVIELPKALTALQDRLLSLEASYAALPLVSQLQSAGLFTWAMLIGWFLIGRTRERGLGWLLLAPLMTLLACLLSAGFSIGSRYALPIVYTAPYLLCVFARPVLRDAAGGGAITEAAGTAAQKVETNE